MTEYACVSTADLVMIAQQREGRTAMEVELAMRLEVAEHMINQLVIESDDGPPLKLVL